jgi:hypothetical protein
MLKLPVLNGGQGTCSDVGNIHQDQAQQNRPLRFRPCIYHPKRKSTQTIGLATVGDSPLMVLNGMTKEK